MTEKILTVSRGCVLTVQESTTSGQTKAKGAFTQSQIISYTYDPSVTKFVKSSNQDCINIAANQVITCRNDVEDFVSGTVQPCLLVEKEARSGTYKYQVLLLQNDNKIFETGSFSHTSSLSKCNLWLLNGPTICWEEKGKLFIAKKSSDESGVYFVEQMPAHLWNLEYRLKWCGATNKHLVLMATGPSIGEEGSTSDVWCDDLDAQKWMTIQCPRLEINKGEIITNLPPIPHPYASIVTSVRIIDKLSGQATTFCKGSTPLVLAATTQGQLLGIHCGRVQLVCDLPFKDPSEIVVVSRCEGEDLVVVKSQSGTMCAVGRQTFQILQQWDNVSSIFVDDFLCNGGEQMLLVSADSISTNPLQDFILTDLDGCYIDDKESKPSTTSGASESSSGACDDNLMSAIRALETRLQSALGSLRQAEGKYDEKKKLIQQSQHALLTMVNGQENDGIATKDQSHLICLYNGSSQSEDDYYPNQGLSSMVTNESKDSPIHVDSSWQRVIDRQWVVGVTVRNNSHSKMESVTLSLIPINSGRGRSMNHKVDPMTSECKVKFPNHSTTATKTTQLTSEKSHEPTRKRQKLNIEKNYCLQLEPGAETDVVAVAPLPVFAGYSVVCCELVIQWNTGNQTVKDREDQEGGWSEKAKCCGRVWLSAVDVASSKLGIDLVTSESRTGDQFNQDTLALDAIQMSTALIVRSLHSNLSCVSAALKSSLGFINYSEAVHDGMGVCPLPGILWGVRVKWLPRDLCNGQMVVFTRDKQQLMLFCHTLQHQLPDDISINPPELPHRKVEESITNSIQSMKQEVTAQVSELQTMQSLSIVQDQHEDEDVMEVGQTEGSEVTEAAKVTELRRKFKKEHLKGSGGESLNIKKENVRKFELDASDHQERTDMAVRTLARNITIQS